MDEWLLWWWIEASAHTLVFLGLGAVAVLLLAVAGRSALGGARWLFAVALLVAVVACGIAVHVLWSSYVDDDPISEEVWVESERATIVEVCRYREADLSDPRPCRRWRRTGSGPFARQVVVAGPAGAFPQAPSSWLGVGLGGSSIAGTVVWALRRRRWFVTTCLGLAIVAAVFVPAVLVMLALLAAGLVECAVAARAAPPPERPWRVTLAGLLFVCLALALCACLVPLTRLAAPTTSDSVPMPPAVATTRP